MTQNRQVVILAPTGRDATLTAAVLEKAAVESVICPNISCVEDAIANEADALLIAEEALGGTGLNKLVVALSRQPTWSDIPIVLLTRHQAESLVSKDALNRLSNVTLIERPVRPATLISVVRSALKARSRQYDVRAHLAERERNEESLRAADQRKDEFLATLAHELRNPLAPIRNSLHILRLSTNSDPALERITEMMERQVGLLVRLVDDLLEVSRISRGIVELRVEPVELARILQSAVEASRPLIDGLRHNLTISLPTEPLVVEGDPVRLSQVVCNLLNNSVKYMNEGGQIWLTVKRQNENVVISVRDTGIGIAADKIGHIFEMFNQVDRSSRQSQGGLGIGLTLVRVLIELHGGHVEAKSEGINRGSEFAVTLPLSKNVPMPVPTPIDLPRQAALPNRKLLVVDDNRDAATSLGRLLGLLGVEVRIANDGPAALESMEAYRPDIVLLDIGMPSMDGYEVARRIRSNPKFRNVLLIALTGWGQAQDRQRTTEAGFDHHLIKPADINAIQTLLMSSNRCEH